MRKCSFLSRPPGFPLLRVLLLSPVCCAWSAQTFAQSPAPASPLSAGDISLKSLSPQVRIWNPTRATAAAHLQASTSPDAIIDLPSESVITYSVPRSARSISGIATYLTSGATYPAQDRRNFNRVRVRFLVDGKQALDLRFDRYTPPQSFTVPLDGVQQLAVQTESEFGFATVSLSAAVFSQQAATMSSRHMLDPQNAFVDVAPEPRQFFVHTYYADERVPVALEAAANAPQQNVAINFQSESQHIATPTTFTAQTHGSAKVHVGDWTVPQTLGPAVLSVTVRVSGQTEYASQSRIVVIQSPNPLTEANANLGVHVSSSGYPMLQDEFAFLWRAQWARVFLRWELTERSEGQYDFTDADALVDIYTAQPLKLLMVLGESMPEWVAHSTTPPSVAFAKFVEAAVRHYHGKVAAWDVYNEIDAKKLSSGDAILLLQQGIKAIRRGEPAATIVCCSLGSSSWRKYNAALRDAGIFQQVDAASMHPYMQFAPEQRDGPFNYLERIAALRSVIGTGRAIPLWSSEANWILGAPGADEHIDEHTQAQYVVRVNLLSIAAGVPYFSHMPFFHLYHPEIMLDELGAYHAMASIFAGGSNAKLLQLPDNVFAVVAQSGADTVGAIWTSSEGAGAVRVTGLQRPEFSDFYGNAVSAKQSILQISGDPVYFRALGGQAPTISVVQPPPAPRFQPLPDLSKWTPNSKSAQVEQSGHGLKISSAPSTYSHLITSPLLGLQARTCYILRAKLRLMAGGFVLAVLDSTETPLGKVLVPELPDATEHETETRFDSGDSGQVRVVVAAGNSTGPAISTFMFDEPEIARCDGK